ncbi:MAG: Ig-like domain-containing protein [Firmicutes bacterium]|nr:Ig-like domain-containing protein [Bacillota bacterium]
MGKQSLKVGAGKSKWFARLVMLAMGLVLSVGGVLAIGQFGGSNNESAKEEVYAQITSGMFNGTRIDASATLHWTFRNTGNTVSRILLLIDGVQVTQLSGSVGTGGQQRSGTHNLSNYVAVGSNPQVQIRAMRSLGANTTANFDNWTRTGTLARPTASVSGSTLSWNSVGSATGYQIRRGTTVIRTVGNVTSYNLANIPVANLAAATNHTNINVVAISSAWYWNNSSASANVTWARRATLAAPTGVGISGANLVWTHDRANTTHFEIRLGATVLATVAAGSSNSHTFDLRRLPGYSATGTQVGAYRALAVGAHSLTVVARNTTAGTLWDNSPASSAVTYTREGRVSAVTISGTQHLTVSWPRPDAVNGMPTGQLNAAVTAFHGTNTNVTWSSVNPNIVSVDPLSGAIAVAWPSGMSMWELSQRVNQFTVIRATSVVGRVVAEFRVDVLFETPPIAFVAGVSVSGGERAFELSPCGTTLASGASLTNATQFNATAYGYNLAGAGNEFVWASSDTRVATIDAYGRLTIRGAGTARISATSTIGNVPYAFDIAVAADGTAIATNVVITCSNYNNYERRLVMPYNVDVVGLPYVDLRATIEGHNITNQLVTWTSSCGATLGSPSQFLEFALTENGIRVIGLAAASHIIITATPVGAVGAVGTFRIFVDRAVEPSVTDISVNVPSSSTLVVPVARPIASADLPSVQLTAATSGIAGGSNSAVVWTVYPLGFVQLVVDPQNPNIVSVVALDRGQAAFTQEITITATSLITQSRSASRTITVTQASVVGIEASVALSGADSAAMFIPYGTSTVYERQSIDLRAVVAVSHSSVSQGVRWEISHPNLVQLDNLRTQAASGGLDSLVTLRPLGVGTLTIRARGAYCNTVSNVITIEIVQASPTSVVILGPTLGASNYEMAINFPRPEAVLLPTVQLGASIGGSFAAASGLVWTSSCGGAVVEFLGGSVGALVLVRGVGAGVALITATHTTTGFYARFTIGVDEAALYSAEILGDDVVREQTAMLIPLVYIDGFYALSELAERQALRLSLSTNSRGEVASNFVWSSSDESVVRLSSGVTSMDGFVTALPYGVGVAIITARSVVDGSIYATFTIFVTRGSASCVIQDGILDLPTIAEGDVRVIFVCEHYFGAARMSHTDMSLEYALEFVLPQLQIDIYGAIFFGWSLSRGGSLLASGSENESGQMLPIHLLEYGADTILLFAVWYIPYVPSENGGSNLARNIIIGTLSVAGVGAAGTAGYIAQSRIRARRNSEANEWGLDN